MKLRIQFSKHGSMKFIGHLDTMRYFQKAIRRAKIDIAYTEGFSPHQIMTFAQPLGVGLESDSEIVDIEVNSLRLLTTDDWHTDETSSLAVLIAALSAQMSEGFAIRDIRLLPDDAGNAMASVSAASYSVRLNSPLLTDEMISEAIEHIRNSKQLLVLKKTKKSETEIDIRPRIYSLSFDDGEINMCVDASSAGNIKPELIIRAIYDDCDASFPEESVNHMSVTRREIYGTDADGELKPLISFGYTENK